ncbi:hypothetical protein [Marinobacter xestospongiae]|uniref:Integrase n=1 Tax=Marinobacter xestospongiae TaxID=994319 RepID=A0ABU3W409_9GAMM|nr:hypothetical protein [Marinobacter xestospongiae]MDV2081080.1 hypothetical protein [Marinobacter xestospongiae]
MATITSRTRKNGTKSYRAEIKLRRKGTVVYQESLTLDRKALAKDWAARRELELQEPGVIDKVRHRGVTVGSLIERYQKEFGDNFGRSKHCYEWQSSTEGSGIRCCIRKSRRGLR